MLEGGEKMKKMSLLLLCALMLTVSVSYSYADLCGIFRNKRMAEELKLTDKQIESIEQLVRNTEKETIKLRAEMELKEIDLRDVLDEDAPDEAAAISLIKGIMALKTEHRVLKVKEMIKIKKTLTPDQIDKFHEIQHERLMREKHMRKGERGGMPHPDRERPPLRD